jgi:alpha-tubulin suppressor-like RCC1 family protein
MKVFNAYSLVLACAILCTSFYAAPSRADETVPGSACTVAGQIQNTGGPEQMPGRDLICDGTVWRILTEKSTSGTSLYQVGYDSGSCTAAKAGRLRYASGTDVWEYCDGSDPWLPFKKPLCQNDDTGECLLAAARNSGDADFIAANIANGVNILGVVGTRTDGSSSPIVQVTSEGNNASCYRTSSGRAFCWGDYSCIRGNGNCTNNWGLNIPTLNYGNGDWTSVVWAQEVYGKHTNWTSIVSEANHSCGIRGGALYCWGDNADGQLGTGNNTVQFIPTAVSGGFTDWTYVAVGGVNDYTGSYSTSGRTCGIRNSNRLYCWGSNISGALGIGSTINQNSPQQVSGATADWAQVAGGAWHTCAVKTTGRLYCWGWGDNGALGSGTTTRNTPREVTGGGTDWQYVATGQQHTCAVKTTGRLYCWGWNGNGELGVGNTTQYSTPREVSGSATDWSFVAAGLRTTCAIKTNGRLYCWGFGGGGELGNGSTTNTQSTPIEVAGGYTDWVDVSLGGATDAYPTSSTTDDTWGRVCALRANGLLYCWGYTDGAFAGDGIFRQTDQNSIETSPKLVPVSIFN